MKQAKKIRWMPFAGAALLILAAVCLWLGVKRSSQSSYPFVMRLPFEGEYSQNGGEWQTLTPQSNISALNGDLTLRGHFSYDIGEVQLNYFINHITAVMSVNGETVIDCTYTEMDTFPFSCGKGWESHMLPAIKASDTVVITLHNPHSFGNSHAYRDFIDTLYPGQVVILGNYMQRYTDPFEALGWVIVIVAFMLLGASGICFGLGNSLGTRFGRLALLCLFAGLYTVLDTINATPLYTDIAFATYGRQLCMMLALLMFDICVMPALLQRLRRAAGILVTVLGVFDAVLIALAVLNISELYDTGAAWAIAQTVLNLLLAAGCIWTLMQKHVTNRFELFSFLPIFAALLVDMTGITSCWYTQGTCTKIVFAVVILLYLYRALRSAMANHRAAGKLQEMSNELEDSRIAIMLSQIQPHFLYNALTSIAQLCEKNPKQAKKTTIDFSEYLRQNMRSLSIKEPIPFESELEHVKTYLSIEQIRFGDRLKVAYDISADDFSVPALSLQPIVENAVKHGVGRKRGGGTVTITTSETDTAYIVCVKDDGVGFDTEATATDARRHVGIENVNSRLAAQCGGSLDIKSEVGTGTTATITLPKESAK